jgi:glutamate 5-kinase
VTTVSKVAAAKRIVLKVGSSSITGANEAQLDAIVDLCVRLMSQGKEVVLVSSGAIATASPLIGLAAKPEDLATSQALASIGQARLMGRYERSLSRHNRIPGQVLLTVENIADSQSSENASRALERLISLEVLPIINENDSVATQEIRFGDNDQLAAKVAILVNADLLILLSDIDSLYTKPPTESGAERIEVVQFGEDLSGLNVSGTSTGYGTGGAVTKVVAATLATDAGIPVLLTSAQNSSLLDTSTVNHTLFLARTI